jgi:hypothetical protein
MATAFLTSPRIFQENPGLFRPDFSKNFGKPIETQFRRAVSENLRPMELTAEVNQQRFVAFLDVLGFSDFVDRNEHLKLTNVYENLLTGMLPIALPGTKLKTLNEGTPEAVTTPDLSEVDVHALLISDSILFFSDRADQQGLIQVLTATQRRLCLGFYNGLPLRGAISLGPLAHQPGSWESRGSATFQALYGQALVDAKRLEGIQQWSGAIVDERAVDIFDRIAANADPSPRAVTSNDLVDHKLLRRYNVPVRFRPGNDLAMKDEWVSNWPWGNGDRPSTEMVRGAFSMHGKNPDAAEEKIQQTLRFLNSARPGEPDL